MLDLDGPHWSFMLATYGEPGVSPACLVLQDTHGVDVNILLACAYAALTGKAVTAAGVGQLDEAIGPWRRAIVEPLRGVRRTMKTGPSPAPSEQTNALRRDLQALEIRAEQIALAVLTDVVKGFPAAPAAETNRTQAALAEVISHAVRTRGGNAGAVLADPDTQQAIATIAQAAERHRDKAAASKG